MRLIIRLIPRRIIISIGRLNKILELSVLNTATLVPFVIFVVKDFIIVGCNIITKIFVCQVLNKIFGLIFIDFGHFYS
jgi:hypothetical protein